MITIDKPDLEVIEVVEVCKNSMREGNELKEKLAECTTEIISGETVYKQLSENKDFHLFPPSEDINGILDHTDMSKIYNEKFVGGAARDFYDQIKLLVIDEKCPFCGQKNIKEMDHFLPKEKYPILAITPINLIPICKDCNFIKKSHTPTSYETILFNPYFDNFNSEKWLKAKVSKSLPLKIKFFIVEDNGIAARDLSRIKETFKVLDLAKIYRIEANTEINNMKYSWKTIYRKKGGFALHERLREDAESRREYRVNSWQTALYEALAESDWFYNDLISNM